MTMLDEYVEEMYEAVALAHRGADLLPVAFERTFRMFDLEGCEVVSDRRPGHLRARDRPSVYRALLHRLATRVEVERWAFLRANALQLEFPTSLAVDARWIANSTTAEDDVRTFERGVYDGGWRARDDESRRFVEDGEAFLWTGEPIGRAHLRIALTDDISIALHWGLTFELASGKFAYWRRG